MPILLALGSELVAVAYLTAITMLVGALSFHFLVWRRTSLPLGPVRAAATDEMFTLVLTCGKWSSRALLLLVVPRAFGAASLLDDRFPIMNRMTALLVRSEWGFGLAAVATAAALSVVGYIGVARRRSWGWQLNLLGVLVLAIGCGLQGHPADAFASMTVAPIFDGLHAVSTGGWLGAYFLLVLAERRVPAHTASPWTDPLGGMLESYFSASGALATTVVITGVFSGATHLTGFDDITGTQYGRVLAGKVAIVGILMVFNEFHRRHAERLARTSERPRLVRTLHFEAGIIALVLALSAILVDTDPPGVNQVGSETFRSAPSGMVEVDGAAIEP